jgi:NAD(P)-dependent dehydrogenase (short-subunit alcohol dehydrogenase family)
MGSNRRLEGKAAIVIGVSEGGIGKAVAMKFASEGASVTVSSRTQSRIDKVAEEIRATGGQAIAVSADATIKDHIDNMVEATVKRYGTVDILFYNAGGGGRARGAPTDITIEDWQDTIEQNLTGAFICTQAVLKKMMPQQSGRIIITASGTGVRPVSGDMPAYGVANAGEIALAKSLAAATTYDGITVNVICPGAVNSPEWNAVAARRFPSGVKGEPINVERFNQPEEIADVVLFLASYESRALTGGVINLYFRSDMRAYSVWRETEPQYVERPSKYKW